MKDIGLRFSGIIGIALLWEILPRCGIVDDQFFPPFSIVLGALGQLAASGVLFTSVMVSLWRSVTGLLIALAIGLPLGLFFGRTAEGIEESFNLLFRFLSQFNPFSLMPVFILFFGIGEAAKLAIVAWVCVWPVFFNTAAGARNIDPALIKTARAGGTPRFSLFCKVVVPASSLSIFTGLRLGLEMSFFMLLAAEMVGASFGIGWLLHNSGMNLRFERMYAAVFLAIFLGCSLTLVLKYIERRAFFWREEIKETKQGTSRKPLTKIDLCLVCAITLFVFFAGFWQIGVARQKQAEFNHTGHSEHMPVTKGASME